MSFIYFDSGNGFLTNEGVVALRWDYGGIHLEGKDVYMVGGRIKQYTGSKFADNAAAIAGGLEVGDIYATSTGELRVVV